MVMDGVGTGVNGNECWSNRSFLDCATAYLVGFTDKIMVLQRCG